MWLAAHRAWESFKKDLAPYAFPVWALVLTMISIIIELGPNFRSQDYWEEYSIFGVCMLSGAITFYALVGITSIWKIEFLGESNQNQNVVGIGASTFFVRLGAVVFSIVAIVLWIIELFLAFAAEQRPQICIIRTFLYIIFHAAQLLFVVKSSRMKFNLSKVIVYFGLAHVLAVNFWTWISLCIAKSGIHNEHEVHHVHFFERPVPFVLHPTETPKVVNTTFPSHEYELRAVKYFGETAIALLTCNVQFCLISAEVCLSLFMSVASGSASRTDPQKPCFVLDYRNTTIATSCATIMLIFTCFAVAVNSIFKGSNYPKAAGITLGSFEIFFYTISILACIISYDAVHRNTLLQNRLEEYQRTSNVIFLFIGAGGEIIFCSVGLFGVTDKDLLSLSLATFAVRLVEVVVQTTLLFYLLRRGGQTDPCKTIGKQAITFLLGLNIILFGFHTIETSVESFGFPHKIDETHLIFLRIAIPLVVFFRFHCSLCFAEIWKSFYHLEVMMISVPSSRRPSNLSAPVEVAPSPSNSMRYLIQPDPPEEVLI